MSDVLYVQYGCGWSAPMEWRNYDASPTLRFERLPVIGKLYTRNDNRFPRNVLYGDIVKGLPVELESCEGVYCSHVLEHLTLSDFRIALANSFNILRPGGVFRLVLPDLEYSIDQYRNNRSSVSAFDFMRETSLGLESRPKGIRRRITSWLGNSEHHWMWDYLSLESELVNVGFMDVRRAHLGDSSDPVFGVVEDESRWTNCLGVECRRG